MTRTVWIVASLLLTVCGAAAVTCSPGDPTTYVIESPDTILPLGSVAGSAAPSFA